MPAHQDGKGSLIPSFDETAAGTQVTLEFRKASATSYRATAHTAKTDTNGVAHWTLPKAKRKPVLLFRARSAACTTGERAYQKPPRKH